MMPGHRNPFMYYAPPGSSHGGAARFWRDRKYKIHRSHGPAVEFESGEKTWFSHGDIICGETGFRMREIE